MRGLWIAAAVVVLVVPQQGPAVRDPRIFHAATDLVTITVTVRDQDGHLVTDLPRDAFDVREDGEPQTISQFTAERVPLSLVVLLDTSDSMFGQRLADARDAVERFITDLLNPSDEFALVAFNHATHLVMNWRQDHADLHAALQRLQPFGSTALYDAIVAELPLAEIRHRERVAFLIISDGADTASDAKLRDVRSALNRSEVFVYAVAIDAPGRRPINAAVDPIALSTITDQSGGHTEVVKSTGALLEALTRIAEELNSQYLLGYTSAKSIDGEYHTIRVRIRDHREYRLQARRGYLAARRDRADGIRR